MDSVEGYQRLQWKLIGCKTGLGSGRWSSTQINVKWFIFGRSDMIAEYSFNGKTLGSVEDQKGSWGLSP